MYEALMRRLLRRIDAEVAHRIGMLALELLGAIPPLRALVRRRFGPDPRCGRDVFGRRVTSPLGVAAGLDKNARAVLGLTALGFGFVEIGTVTARPQPGNARPRLFRLLDDRAVVNRMGFNNDGAAVVAGRLRRLRAGRAGRDVIVGVNIGRSKSAGSDETVDDYCLSARLLAPYADYLVVNISSPNTPGLRDLHHPELLRPLLSAVAATCATSRTRSPHLPLLLKISPDLADEDVRAVAAVVRELGLDGAIATNTTVGRTGLRTPDDTVTAMGPGGLSGRPLRERAEQVQRLLRAELPGCVLIASGGVDRPDDAVARLAAGADLVEAWTGFIYGGPRWPAETNAEIARSS